MFKLPISKLSLLLLPVIALSLSACQDDDDVIGFDLDDDGTLFLSSNTSGMVGILDLEDSPLEIETFQTRGTDADGLYYDSDQGNLFQVNRSSNTVVEYNDVIDDLDDPNGVDIESESASTFTNGRGLAVRNDILVVAEDGGPANGDQNSFALFRIASDEVIDTLATFPTTINLWGIQFVDDDLYAVVDNSDSIAVFTDFLSNNPGDTVMPSRFIRVVGIGRTHGLEYNAEDDIMILTDIGDAGSDNDGSLVVVRDFSTVGNSTSLEAANYTRIGGAATRLGNPVDVAYDADEDRIYVAERANSNGTLLIFDGSASGDAAPVSSLPFPGLSSLYLHRD